MASILVCYGTGEGQARKVAGRIGGTLEDHGHAVTVVDADDCPPDLDLERFDAALVGGSIQAGRHQASVRTFVAANRTALLGRPSGFFQVSRFSAAPDERRQALAASIADDLFEATGWYPDLLGLFGGAIRYSMYGYVKRQMVRWWARRTTGDTDTSRDYEYTDWDAVEQFAADFAAFVERELSEPTDGDAIDRYGASRSPRARSAGWTLRADGYGVRVEHRRPIRPETGPGVQVLKIGFERP